jgi:hypothetical protein
MTSWIWPLDVIKRARKMMISGLSLKQCAAFMYVSPDRLDQSLWHWIGKTEEAA